MRRGGILWGLSLALLLTACGAPTPAPTASPAPTPTVAPAGPLVKTDWSKLTPRESGAEKDAAEIGSRWYEAYTGELVPSGDYGTLVPYAGERLGDGYGEGFNYGLMTMDGAVVTDPVYSDVTAARYGPGEQNTLPLYILRQGAAGAGEDEIENRYAVAARDGSWCTGFDYEFVIPGPDGVFLVTEEACMVMNTAGETVRRWTWADLGYPEGKKPTWSPSPMENIPEWCGGKVPLDLVDDKYDLLDTRTGERSQMNFEDFWELRSAQWDSGLWTVTPDGETTVLTKENGRKEWPAACARGWEEGGYAVLIGADERCAAYDLDGNLLVSAGRYEDLSVRYDEVTGKPYLMGSTREGGYQNVILDAEGNELAAAAYSSWSAPYPNLVNGLAEIIDEETVSYYRADGTCVFRRVLASALGDD